MKIGVLALQGAFREHIQAIKRLGYEAIEIKKPEQLDMIDGLIIPGGESTTIGKLLIDFGLMDKLREKTDAGLPIFGTCAGLILLAKKIEDQEQPTLKLMDIEVKRNAFGRQRESFEAELDIPALGKDPVKAIFIRAPYIIKTEPNVGILCTYDDKIIMARQGNFLVSSFHPELTDDLRVHQYFINMVKDAKTQLN